MEEFFLCTFLTDNELNIIDQQNVVRPVLIAELSRREVVLITDGINQLIGEFLTRYIKNLCIRVIFQNKMTDGMHQMRFSESHASIDKKRVVDFSRGFGNRQRCSMGQIVVGTDYKGIECIFRI